MSEGRDARLRQLRRAAASGDSEAAASLEAEERREGLPAGQLVDADFERREALEAWAREVAAGRGPFPGRAPRPAPWIYRERLLPPRPLIRAGRVVPRPPLSPSDSCAFETVVEEVDEWVCEECGEPFHAWHLRGEPPAEPPGCPSCEA